MNRVIRWVSLAVLVTLLPLAAAWADDGVAAPQISKMGLPPPCNCLYEDPGIVHIYIGGRHRGPFDLLGGRKSSSLASAPAAIKGPVTDLGVVGITTGSGPAGMAGLGGGALSIPFSGGPARSVEQETRRSLKKLIRELG